MRTAEQRAVPAQTTAVQAVTKRTQSTHDVAAMASAARMIRVLRHVYPEHENPAQEAQGFLVRYLPHKIAELSSEGAAAAASVIDQAEIQLARLNICISATVILIDRIFTSSEYTRDDKIAVFEQMKSIAETCPGLAWDSNHEKWSANSIYNPKSGKSETVMASLAETLNLACCAVLDRDRYLLSETEDADPEKDERQRILSLFNRLLALQKYKNATQHDICSAGRQHDLLFLLNHVFLEEPRSKGGAKSIILIENTETFLFDSLCSWIKKEMESLSEGEKLKLMLDWIKWGVESESNADDISPVAIFLRNKYPSGSEDKDAAWKIECSYYLATCCSAFGLNSRDCKLGDMANLSAIDALNPPATESVIILFSEILKIQSVILPAASAVETENEMLHLRNAALENIKHLQPEALSAQAENIKAFYAVESLFQQMRRDAHLTGFLSLGDEVFRSKQQALQQIVKDYYASGVLTTEFESRKKAYLTHQAAIAEPAQVAFVENFFVVLQSGSWEAQWNQLQALKPKPTVENPNPIHPLILTDSVIETWHRENRAIDAVGCAVLDISAYEVNRFLLHALLVLPADWSPLFIDDLLLVINWLSQPGTLEDSVSLNGLKKSYPSTLLINLKFFALLHGSTIDASNPLDSLCIDERGRVFWRRTSMRFENFGNFENIIQGSIFYSVVCGASDASCVVILNAIRGSLAVWIQAISHIQVLRVFLLSAQFTDDECIVIWNVVKERLRAVPDGKNIEHFYLAHLSLIMEVVPEHNTVIWSEVKEMLAIWVVRAAHIGATFRLALLTDRKYAAVWDVIKEKPAMLSAYHNELAHLLSTRKLTDAQRADIVAAVPALSSSTQRFFRAANEGGEARVASDRPAAAAP